MNFCSPNISHLSSEYVGAVPVDLAEIYKQLFSVTIFKSDVFLTNMEVSFSWLRAVDKEKTWNLEGFLLKCSNLVNQMFLHEQLNLSRGIWNTKGIVQDCGSSGRWVELYSWWFVRTQTTSTVAASDFLEHSGCW